LAGLRRDCPAPKKGTEPRHRTCSARMFSLSSLASAATDSTVTRRAGARPRRRGAALSDAPVSATHDTPAGGGASAAAAAPSSCLAKKITRLPSGSSGSCGWLLHRRPTPATRDGHRNTRKPREGQTRARRVLRLRACEQRRQRGDDKCRTHGRCVMCLTNDPELANDPKQHLRGSRLDPPGEVQRQSASKQ
jgi:hypothetical protein